MIPFLLYLAFMCSWFLHLPARLDALAALRADLLLVAMLLPLSAAALRGAATGEADARTHRVLWVLIIYAIVSMPLVEWPGSVVKTGFPQFLKAFVFFCFTVAFVRTPKRLAALLGVYVGCQTFRVLEPLYLHVTQGYWGDQASMADWEMLNRLSGAPSDVVNPNGLAFIVLSVLPFMYYVTAGRKLLRVACLALLPALLYALMLTGSRSGLVGLMAIGGLVWLKSRHKVALACTFVLIVAAAVPHLSADMADRYLSLFSSETRNSATVDHRWSGIADDAAVVMRRPLFGHGLGTSREANANYGRRDQLSHNLYVEVGQELGLIGLVIFLTFMYSLWASVRNARRQVAATAGAATLSNVLDAVQVWVGMNIVFSISSFGLSGYEWYFAAGLVTATLRVAQPAIEPVVQRPVPVSWTPTPAGGSSWS